MKFLLSIPCQVIVVVLIAVTVSSFVGQPLQPLASALSVANAPGTDPTGLHRPGPDPSSVNVAGEVSPLLQKTVADSFHVLSIAVALTSAFATFLLWHFYRFYRSQLAIAQVKRVGGSVKASGNRTGVMQYIFSDMSVSFSDRKLSNANLPELHQIHNLTRLNLSNCGVDQKSLASIVYCRFLQEIDLRGNDLSRESLLHFNRKTTAKMLHR